MGYHSKVYWNLSYKSFGVPDRQSTQKVTWDHAVCIPRLAQSSKHNAAAASSPAASPDRTACQRKNYDIVTHAQEEDEGSALGSTFCSGVAWPVVAPLAPPLAGKPWVICWNDPRRPVLSSLKRAHSPTCSSEN